MMLLLISEFHALILLLPLLHSTTATALPAPAQRGNTSTTNTTASNAVPDPYIFNWNDLDFRASGYREPRLPTQEFDDFLLESLYKDVLDSALNRNAGFGTRYGASPVRFSDGYVDVKLEKVGSSSSPAGAGILSYGDCEDFIDFLVAFYGKWTDSETMPTFDVALSRRKEPGGEWRGVVTVYDDGDDDATVD